jgi:hypothetical protein
MLTATGNVSLAKGGKGKKEATIGLKTKPCGRVGLQQDLRSYKESSARGVDRFPKGSSRAKSVRRFGKRCKNKRKPKP